MYYCMQIVINYDNLYQLIISGVIKTEAITIKILDKVITIIIQ